MNVLRSLMSWWKNLSIFKKLYGVVGIMALLIAVELFSMLFTMHILSAVRSFVGGEGLWSKAQKDSIQSLYEYVLTEDRKYYLEFQQYLLVPLGDRRVRVELQKPHPDLEVARQGFLQGQIHPNDIPGLIDLFLKFHDVIYLRDAIAIWGQADDQLDGLIAAGADLDDAITSQPRSPQRIRTALEKVDALNKQFTVIENKFSEVLGEGSRWLEGILKVLLIFAVLIVESTGLYLTFSFSRHLSRSIRQTSAVAEKVGMGDFTKKIPVRSEDELGQLAKTINRMIYDLENSIGRRQKAEIENQTKSLFLANMSHEIRTPLGVILGLTAALKHPDVTKEEQVKFIDTIDRTGQDLRQIINDILDISKVEAGYLDIEKSRFSLGEFLADLQAALGARVIKNENTLVFVNESKNDQDMIYTDRTRLRQILTNILGNALKFTRSGLVKMNYWSDAGKLYFRVTDTGIGMTTEQSTHLFHAFSQVDSSSTRKFGGTGLGLFLSKHLAILLGGNIILEKSVPEKGSSFLISIEADHMPAAVAATPALVPTESSTPNFKGKKILIVDDSPDNQLLLQFFLKKWNIDFVSAENGKEGVDKASHEKFDLILMDIQMPLMDGYEATRELRKMNFKNPIIALTAHAMKVDQERCMIAGCDKYLTKPVDITQFYETLSHYLSHHDFA